MYAFPDLKRTEKKAGTIESCPSIMTPWLKFTSVRGSEATITRSPNPKPVEPRTPNLSLYVQNPEA